MNREVGWHAFAGYDAAVRAVAARLDEPLAPAATNDGGDWAWWAFSRDGATVRPLAEGDELLANYLTEVRRIIAGWRAAVRARAARHFYSLV